MQLKCYVMKWKEILWYKDSNETPLVGILCSTKMVFSFLVKLIYWRCLGFLYNKSVERVSCKSLSCLSIILLNAGDKKETSKLKTCSVQNIVVFKILFSQLSCIPFLRQSYLLFINGTKSACFASVGKFFSLLYCLLAFVLVEKACNSLKKKETKMLLMVQLFLFSWRKHWTLIHPFSILLKVYFALSF